MTEQSGSFRAAARLLEELADAECTRFEREWKNGARPQIESYLAGHDAPICDLLIDDLIHVEAYYRYRLGETPEVADYQSRFPDVSADRIAAALQDQTEKLVPVRFRLLAEVGSGAFGVVWRAMDTKLNRLVALKVPHPGPGSGPEALERFRREAQAAARLRHPGIAPVFDVAEVDGRPALVAEYVAGDPLSDILARCRPTAAQAAAVVAALADALDYAHSMGAVHRDVKPGNVLIVPDPPGTTASGMSALAGFGRPVLVDFGLALREGSGDATLTTHGQVLGTPAYMSPEQAAGHAHTVDRRSDVYSLGVVLYETLAGRPPFLGDRVSVVEQVRSVAPLSPRSVDRSVPRDLEVVCLKAMAKEPAHRYRTAAALADDLRRYLRGEPVRARPPWTWERAYHWARRRPTAAALMLVSSVAVAAMTSAGLLVYHTDTLARANAAEAAQRQEAEAMRHAAEAMHQAADTALYFNRVALASRELEKNNIGFVRQLLDNCPTQKRGWEWRYLRQECDESILGIPHTTRQGTISPNSVVAVAYSPDGRTLATGSWDGLVNLWDADTGMLRRRLPSNAGGMAIAFSPDGARLVTGDYYGVVRVWDMGEGSLLREWKTGDQVVYSVAFSPDGSTIAAGTGPSLWVVDDAGWGRVFVWNTETSKELLRLGRGRRRITAVAFRPDGQSLAAATGSWYNAPKPAGPGGVTVWSLPSGRPIREINDRGEPVAAVAWSPDGTLLAAAGWDQSARVYDSETGTEQYQLGGHRDWVRGICWSPDGRTLATVSLDGGVRVWNSATGHLARLFRGHSQAVNAVAWRPDGGRLATASSDGTVKVWDSASIPNPLVFSPLLGELLNLSFSQNGDVLFAVGRKEERSRKLTLCALDPRTGAERSAVTFATGSSDRGEEADRGEIGPDANNFALVLRRNDLLLHDLQQGIIRWEAHKQVGQYRYVRFSPDGRIVVAVGYRDPTPPVSTHTISISGWDVVSGKPLPFESSILPGTNTRVTFHPSGRMIAVGCEGTVTIWDVVSGRKTTSFPAHGRVISALEFSPDGTRLATASWDGTAKIWNMTPAPNGDARPEPSLVLLGHMRHITGLAWGPDGTRLATCSEDRSVKLWDASTGYEAITLATNGDLLTRVIWSPDNQRIVATDKSGTVFVWNAATGQ